MSARPLSFLLPWILIACAHGRSVEQPPSAATPIDTTIPASPQQVTRPSDWIALPAPVTRPGEPYATEPTYAAGATAQAYAEPETAPAAPERPSPPPLGAENLAALPEAASPARGASLKLAQDGRVAWLNRDPVVARQKLQSALQLWGNNPYAKYYLGILELEAGHYAQAENFAREAARSLKGNPFYAARTYLLLALVLERSGDAKGAFAARAKADELDPRVELK